MGCMLKFRSPNLHTIIIVTKIRKGFLKKKEKVKGFFILWLCHHSTNLNVNSIRKIPVNEVVVGLLSFLIVSMVDTLNMVLFFQFMLKMDVHAAHMREKICEEQFLIPFLRRVSFILMFFSRRVSFLVI